ncbi:hypothetical protein [Mycobacterium sp. DBP42]|uniref:hypothetical protein n=1 Tax=Mycobacterium sp. DBP42 TaxID=2545267 RepID=UPI00110CBEF0|nr:hypothetical protein [Mycobacterium sp. DBP42]TMS52401.1 hypothetical protein E0T84_15905 [Mycobacterium sp. DBP42]
MTASAPSCDQQRVDGSLIRVVGVADEVDRLTVAGSERDEVVRLTRQQELRQARYYRGLLESQRAEIEVELARDCALLARHLADGRSRRRMPRLRESVRRKRREQYQIECLLESLNMRFFQPRPMPLPDHRFTVEIEPTRHGYRVRVLELDQVVTAVSRDEAEMTAREYIAVSIGMAISRIAVHVSPARSVT